METKNEGAAFPPLPLARPRLREAALRGPLPQAADPPCEMCGAPVIASHCKRICLRCGFGAQGGVNSRQSKVDSGSVRSVRFRLLTVDCRRDVRRVSR